jgi:5-methyltetrahydrofolate--homocysteine methyltransferase
MVETTLLNHIDPLPLGRFIDRRALFMQHWRFRSGGVDRAGWDRRVAVELEPMLSARLSAACGAGIYAPAAVFAVLPSWSDGNDIVLGDPAASGPPIPLARFTFVRDALGRCLADAVPPLGAGLCPAGSTGWFAATLGAAVAEHEVGLRESGDFEEYHLFHGMSVALAEALAEEVHRRVRAAMGISGSDAASPTDIVRGGYEGRRFSFGYPCCPDLANQNVLLEMLGADRIGIRLNESLQMEPELSVTAGVISSSISF